MATVTGYTAARTKQIEDSTIVGGTVDQATKHLLLQARDGSTVDAGKIDGPKGEKGDPGLGNVNTVNGKFGPDIVLNAGDVGALPATTQASETVFGATRLATDAEALAGTSNDRTVTPKKLITVAQDRWERKGSTLLALGTGKYAGQLALLTLASNTYPVEVVWTGARWEPISWRLSGTQAQRDAFQTSGVCFDGVEWYNTTTGSTENFVTNVWTSNTPGLVPITGFTVTPGGSTTAEAEMETPNSVRFTNVFHLYLTNVFTAKYLNYRAIINFTQATGPTEIPVNLNYVNDLGNTETALQYYQNGQGWQINGSNVSRSWYQSGANSHKVNNLLASGLGSCVLDFFAPERIGMRTVMNNKGLTCRAGGNWETIDTVGMLSQTNRIIGIRLSTFSESLLMGGRISFYGYN